MSSPKRTDHTPFLDQHLYQPHVSFLLAAVPCQCAASVPGLPGPQQQATLLRAAALLAVPPAAHRGECTQHCGTVACGVRLSVWGLLRSAVGRGVDPSPVLGVPSCASQQAKTQGHRVCSSNSKNCYALTHAMMDHQPAHIGLARAWQSPCGGFTCVHSTPAL